MLKVKMVDDRLSNDERQMISTSNSLTFDILLSIVTMIQLSNVKLFDVGHSNIECQNETND